jgi:hypothetical protein
MTRMWRPLLLVLGLTGCGVIPAARVNDNCDWGRESASAAIDDRRLIADAVLAEELAIRYADALAGLRSGHYAGEAEYGRTRERCLTDLVDTIAKAHARDPATVREASRGRSALVDILAVFVPMALLYIVAGETIARFIARRFGPDETLARAVTLILATACVSLLGYQVGSLWSFTFEERFRLQTTHLSYRAFYVPWGRHGPSIAIAGACLFLAVTAWRLRVGARSKGHDEGPRLFP